MVNELFDNFYTPSDVCHVTLMFTIYCEKHSQPASKSIIETPEHCVK